ncbi:CHAT domain-containing protein, partial [Actinoplanes sp. NPDC024001]|uniref:CHAT domain-containing protein n=1 Tax=Actinoplanes sp. NPDC024001 TaxID=3154598 RepID=UPI0033C48E5E
QATLAWLAGDRPRRRRHLHAARDAWTTAGDTAGVQLSAVHLLIADLDEGLFAAHAAALGDGGRPPEHGPVAGVLGWAASIGSRAWCTGLGRLLQRAAEHWQAHGDPARARLGYLAALPLLAADPALPARPVITALAGLESRTGLADRALARLERLRHCTHGVAGPPEVALAHCLDAVVAMVAAHRSRIGTAAAEDAARGLLRLRGWIEETLPTLADARPAIDTLAVIDALVPLARCGHAHRRGLPEQAEQWFRVALEAAERSGAPADLRPLVLITGERHAEARTALTELDRDRALPDLLLAPLALRAGDFTAAARSFARAGGAQRNWRSQLTAAQLALEHDDAAAALTYAREGARMLEEFTASLPRDRTRLAASDQDGVSALYLAAARALVVQARAEHYRPDAADLRRQSFAAADRRHALTLRPDRPDGTEPWQEWHRRTADWATHASRLAAAIDTPRSGDTTPLVEAVAGADAALSRAESELERVQRGALLRRAAPPAPLDVRLLQSRLAADTVVLAYLTAGTELMVWAVTPDDVRVHHRRIAGRPLAALVRRFHTRCAAGHGQGPEATELAAVLLADMAPVIRHHRRVVVVPCGPLRLLPFHALPFGARPLGLERVVSYLPSAALLTAEKTVLDEPVRPVRPLVVDGPPVATSILGRAPAVDRLSGHDVLVFGTAPLRDRDLRADAELAVLCAGDLGRTTVTLGDDVAGLTRDLLHAGVRRVVLPLWPVDDEAATVVIGRFLRGLTEGVAPAYALAGAQRFAAQASPGRLRSEATALGFAPAGNEPLDGSAERLWAPFVLLGP